LSSRVTTGSKAKVILILDPVIIKKVQVNILANGNMIKKKSVKFSI
jgi:hypothetical protein